MLGGHLPATSCHPEGFKGVRAEMILISSFDLISERGIPHQPGKTPRPVRIQARPGEYVVQATAPTFDIGVPVMVEK